MARDETGRRKTKKNTQLEKFKKNGRFTGKHVRAVLERQSNQVPPTIQEEPKTKNSKT